MKPLNRGFNVAVNQIASRLFPTGFDVSANAPQTASELIESVKSGRMTVWDGASEQTIFADPETNFAFRAWHDHCHMRPCYLFGGDNFLHLPHPFTREGELRTMTEQARDIFALYGESSKTQEFVAILNAEIIGQFDYNESLGGFPIDQIGFVRLYMSDPLAALNVNFGMSKEGVAP